MEVFFPGSGDMKRRFAVEFIELTERAPTQVGPSVVTALAARHPSGSASYGLRVQVSGKIISYSGDTEWTENLVELARDADVLVCEAYSRSLISTNALLSSSQSSTASSLSFHRPTTRDRVFTGPRHLLH